VRIWDVESGETLAVVQLRGPVHGVAFAEGEREFAVATDRFGLEVPASIAVFAYAGGGEATRSQSGTPRLVIVDKEAPRVNITKIDWLPGNKGLLAAFESGVLRVYDPASGELVSEHRGHDAPISTFCFNKDKSLLLTTSHDRSAKLWDVATMTVLKTYETDTPLNGGSISPLLEHVIVGGGQEAGKVTTTAASAGKFETRIFDMVFASELGRIRGHFGPINTLSYSPDGRSFASGGEDGFIRLHHMDPEYFELGAEDNLDDASLAVAIRDGTLTRLEAEEAEAKRAEEEAAAARAAAARGGAGGPPDGGRALAVH
jgi:translation initiation factor 3 subunit I